MLCDTCHNMQEQYAAYNMVLHTSMIRCARLLGSTPHPGMLSYKGSLPYNPGFVSARGPIKLAHKVVMAYSADLQVVQLYFAEHLLSQIHHLAPLQHDFQHRTGCLQVKLKLVDGSRHTLCNLSGGCLTVECVSLRLDSPGSRAQEPERGCLACRLDCMHAYSCALCTRSLTSKLHACLQLSIWHALYSSQEGLAERSLH